MVRATRTGLALMGERGIAWTPTLSAMSADPAPNRHERVQGMSGTRRFDHVGITVADLDEVAAFFVELGYHVEGRVFLEGEFLDTLIGIPDSRTELLMLRSPDGGPGLELAAFIRPPHEPGLPNAMATELGLRSLAFQVDELQPLVDRLADKGYGLIGGVGEYEGVWRMASVREPEGIIVSLAERIG